MRSRLLAIAFLTLALPGMVRAQPFTGHKDRVQQVAFSPDSQLLASASWDKSVRLWDLKSGKAVFRLAGHTARVESVSFSPNGKLLASAGRDKLVLLWNVASGQPVRALRGHADAVSAVAFSPDGKRLASGDEDGIVRFWDPTSGKESAQFNLDRAAVQHLCFSPDSTRLAVVGSSWALLLDPATGNKKIEIESASDLGDCAAFSPDGKQLVSGHCHWTVWDTTTGKKLRELQGADPGGYRHGMAFSPDGQLLVTANARGRMDLWDAATGAWIREWKREPHGITSVAYSPDGSRVAWCCEDGSIHVESAPTVVKPRSRGPRPPFVPTPQDVVEKMLELAAVKQTNTVVDLGCGDGRIVVTAAKKYGCQAIGYDLDRECLRRARESVKKNQLEGRVKIVEEDIFNVDLSKVDVVTLYLWPTTNTRLLPQLEKMKPGARIVSHAADLKGIVPDKVITVKSKDDEQERKLYLWTLPLKKEPPSK